MSSEQDAIRLYSSSEDEEEDTKCNQDVTVTEAGEPKDSFRLTAFDEEDDSEEEEKKSTPPVKRPRPEHIVTDISTVPTRAQQLQRQHRPKTKNVPWPTRRSRRKHHQERRAPVRQGNTVTFARAAPAADIDGRSYENPQHHTKK